MIHGSRLRPISGWVAGDIAVASGQPCQIHQFSMAMMLHLIQSISILRINHQQDPEKSAEASRLKSETLVPYQFIIELHNLCQLLYGKFLVKWFKVQGLQRLCAFWYNAKFGDHRPINGGVVSRQTWPHTFLEYSGFPKNEIGLTIEQCVDYVPSML